MKNVIIILAIVAMLCCNFSFSEELCTTGIKLIKDSYNKKVFIIKIPSDLTMYNIEEGAEIISIDKTNVKNLELSEIYSLLNSKKNSKIKLTVKYFKKQYTQEIPGMKLQMCTKKNNFDIYWDKVNQSNLEIETIPLNTLLNISREYYSEIVPKVNYWMSVKTAFKDAYQDCMRYGGNKDACLNDLVKRTCRIAQEKY